MLFSFTSLFMSYPHILYSKPNREQSSSKDQSSHSFVVVSYNLFPLTYPLVEALFRHHFDPALLPRHPE